MQILEPQTKILMSTGFLLYRKGTKEKIAKGFSFKCNNIYKCYKIL